MNIIVSNKDITKYHKCLSDLYWFGCYDGDSYFRQSFEPSTYAHPAKISPLLADRIFKHLEKLELLKERMTILDFMSGSGRVPLLASLRGYKSIGVELETHFVKMCNDNKKFAENKIGRNLDMTTIQGDSRQLSKLLSKSDVAVVSPPYENIEIAKGDVKPNDIAERKKRRADDNWEGYNKSNPSNIGNLPYKQMVGVVSPPYQDVSVEGGVHRFGLGSSEKHWSKSQPKDFQHNYSQNPENIGNLKDTRSIVGITSPPYSDVNNRSETDQEWRDKAIKEGRLPKIGSVCSDSVKHSDNPQNIANLKDTSFVGITSPPYAGQLTDEGGNQEINQVKNRPHPYNKNKDDRVQIGNFTRNEWGDIVGITSPPKKESEWCECDD